MFQLSNYFRIELYEEYDSFFKKHKNMFFKSLEKIKNIKYFTGNSNRSIREIYTRRCFYKYKQDNSYKKYITTNYSIPNFKLFIKQETISSLILRESDTRWYGQNIVDNYYMIEYNRNMQYYPVESDSINGDIIDSKIFEDRIELFIQYNSNKKSNLYPNIYNRSPYTIDTTYYKKCYFIDLQTGKCSCPGWEFNKTCKHKNYMINYKKYILRYLCLILNQHIDFNSAICISKNFIN